jgi:hypothetical protein
MPDVYIVVRGRRVGHAWVESTIFNDAWISHGDADGVGTVTEIRVQRLVLRPDLGLAPHEDPRP